MQHVPEGLTFCSCGVCLRRDEETIERMKARFQALIDRDYLARVIRSMGKKYGDQQWQEDHWKAMHARRGSWKHNKGTIVIRWQEDEKYRNSQQTRGWTEEYCRYLDCLTTIDISYAAPWHQSHQCESTITLVSSSCTNESKERFQTHHENSRTFSTRTRTTQFL